MDDYILMLERVCSSIESSYNLDREVGGKVLTDYTIRELIPIINKEVATLPSRDLEERNLAAWPHVGLLAHFLLRFQFFEKRKLSFDGYPRVPEMIKVLKVFSSRRTINKQSKAMANNLIDVLMYVDEKDIKLRYDKELEYRYLRVFVIMILHSNFGDCSAVVKFILWHMEGVPKNVKNTANVGK